MATTYSVTNSFTADTTAVASEVNQNFTDVLTALNAFDASNLSSSTVPLARISGLTTSQFAAATLVIESEGIASNDNDTTIATCAAIKDYVDTQDAIADDDAFGTRTSNDSGASALAVTEIYKVGSDGFVTFNTFQGGAVQIVKLLSDSSATPSAVIYHSEGDWGAGHMGGCVPVKKNDYWQITVAGGATVVNINWLPIGSGTCVKQ